MSVNKEKLLKWAREKGPNTPYYGKDPLLRAIEMEDHGLVLDLIEMGARVERHHAEQSYFLFPSPREEAEKLPRTVGVLAQRLAEQIREHAEGGRPFHYDGFFMRRLKARIENEDLFLRLKPLVLALVQTGIEKGIDEARRWIEDIVDIALHLPPQAVQALREWGVPLKEFPWAVDQAAGSGNSVALELFLQEGISPEGASSKLPPLFRAVAEGDLESIHLLLRYGANPFRSNAFGELVTAYCKSPEVLEFFMDLGVPVAELTKENALALSQIDPPLAVRLLKEKLSVLESMERWKGESAAQREYLTKLVLQGAVVKSEVSGEELLSRLQLFDEIPLPENPFYLRDFQGGLDKLFLLNAWAMSRGVRLGHGWMGLAIRLGADQEALRRLG